MLMRKVGQFMARVRGMAAEFRASFDELARQSELDELRREVEALRTARPLDYAAQADLGAGEVVVSDIKRATSPSANAELAAPHAPIAAAEASARADAEPPEATPPPKPPPAEPAGDEAAPRRGGDPQGVRLVSHRRRRSRDRGVPRAADGAPGRAAAAADHLRRGAGGRLLRLLRLLQHDLRLPAAPVRGRRRACWPRRRPAAASHGPFDLLLALLGLQSRRPRSST